MKKLSLFFVLAFISIATYAQTNFENEFYFRIGYSNPSWRQFGLDRNDWTSKSGFMTEIGTIYMLDISMPENMAVGIDVNYLSVYWHRLSNSHESLDVGTLRLDSKVGPSFTYSPAKNLAFDAYVKTDISWMTATAIVFDDNTDDADGYARIGAFGWSYGINFRYKILMLGTEFNTIRPKLESVDNDGEYLGNFNNDSDRSPLPSLTFTLGLSF